MSDLMLLGALRAPAPEPDNVLGLAQLVDRARQAAAALEAKDKEIERLNAVLVAAEEYAAYVVPDNSTLKRDTWQRLVNAIKAARNE